MENKIRFRVYNNVCYIIVVDPSLNKYDGKTLFPVEHAKMEEMLSQVVNWPPELREKKP